MDDELYFNTTRHKSRYQRLQTAMFQPVCFVSKIFDAIQGKINILLPCNSAFTALVSVNLPENQQFPKFSSLVTVSPSVSIGAAGFGEGRLVGYRMHAKHSSLTRSLCDTAAIW